MLFEKPSHNRTADAVAFKRSLEAEGIDQNRVLIGMHTTLHPSIHLLVQKAKEHAKSVKQVRVCFNYPKNPYAPGDFRLYDKEHGGVMLDLGVYVFQVG